MHLEVEQKFWLLEPEPLLIRLAELGASFAEPIEQVDSYFNHPARDFAKTDEALRIRRVGRENFVTYKGPKLDALTKTRRELELPLAAGEIGFEQFAELLRALGFRAVADVRKTRRPGILTWQGWQVEVAIDEVDALGTFLELELSADGPRLDEARQALLDLSQQLVLARPERRSYLELLLLSRGTLPGQGESNR